MTKNYFNIFTGNNFEIDEVFFKCVFLPKNYSKISTDIDTITHVAELKRGKQLRDSLFDQNSILTDIALLLTFSQGTHIHFHGQNNLFRVKNFRKKDYEFFCGDELTDFLTITLVNLKKIDKDTLTVIKTTLFMYFEAKNLLVYDGLRDILMMNCLEYLVGAIYRKENNYSKNDLSIDLSLSYIFKKNQYQKFIDERLKETLKEKKINKKLSEFKKEKSVRSLGSFIDTFRETRNWIAHGKQHNVSMTSQDRFYFEIKVETVIRLILIDLIYGNDYKRKFDFLYQIILEKNKICTLYPDIATLAIKAK
jgi:hypothetical protein